MTLHVSTTGSPTSPTLLLLHGLGVSSWMWTDQVDELADRFRVVTVDLPGSGASHAERWTSLAGAADQVAGVITDVGGGPAHVVGLSLGGYVTLNLLARHSGLVNSAIVSGVTTGPLEPARVYGTLFRARAALMRRPTVVRMAAAALRLPTDARAAFLEDARRLDYDAARRIDAEVLHLRLPARLTEYADRLLAVAGDREAKAVRAGLGELAAQGATAGVVRRAHHAWNAEHPELFCRMIESWALTRTVPPELERVAPAVHSS